MQSKSASTHRGITPWVSLSQMDAPSIVQLFPKQQRTTIENRKLNFWVQGLKTTGRCLPIRHYSAIESTHDTVHYTLNLFENFHLRRCAIKYLNSYLILFRNLKTLQYLRRRYAAQNVMSAISIILYSKYYFIKFKSLYFAEISRIIHSRFIRSKSEWLPLWVTIDSLTAWQWVPPTLALPKCNLLIIAINVFDNNLTSP